MNVFQGEGGVVCCWTVVNICKYVVRGPESTNRVHQIRACTRYTNQTSLCLSGLVHSLGDPELHWVDPKGRSHVTYPYWLVTQSVTSYINDQWALLGSVVFGSWFTKHWSEEVAVLCTTGSSPFLPRSSERAYHTFRVLPWSSPTPPAIHTDREEVWSTRTSRR